MWVQIGRGLLCGMSHAQAGQILLLSTGDVANDSALANVLIARGESVVLGPKYTTFTDATSLSGISAVVLVPNNGTGDMPTSGQNALLNFIHAGGGLLTSENFAALNGLSGDFSTLEAAIPVSSTGGLDHVVSYVQSAHDGVIDAGLPNSFRLPFDDGSVFSRTGTLETVLVAKAGATVFWTSSSNYGTSDGVVGWDSGSGRVISLSTVSRPDRSRGPHVCGRYVRQRGRLGGTRSTDRHP